MKRQFVRIQPGNPGDVSQQKVPSEAQIREASPLSHEGLTPPAAPDAVEQSPVSYWARKEETQERISNAPSYPQAGAQQFTPNGIRQGVGSHTPPMNQPFVQQSPLMQSQNGYPLVLPSPEIARPPYGPPMQPGTPYGQRPVTGPMSNNAPMQSPYGPPMQPGTPYGQRPVTGPMSNNAPMQSPYGPPMEPGMPYGQRPITGPISHNNVPPMQPPFAMSRRVVRKKRRFPIWARVVVAVVAVLLVGGGTAFGYYQANFANPLGKITGQQAAQIGADGKSTSQIAATTGNGIGSKRVNILLLGSDNDGKNASPLAQTDIVITIDPQTHYVGMLSIPRDLRVVIPDQGTGKMDAAFSFGWQGNFGGSTPLSNAAGLSIATVEKNFGIHIDHYAWVGLDGFVKVINTANGVDIDATHPIADNAYPNDVNTADHFGYKRLYIAPGPQHMYGIQALEYVRTRHADLVGDFGRSARQQQVLSQLKTKLDTPSIITKLPELANDLGDTVKTDMSIQDIVNFMGFARNIDTTKLDRVILSPPYSAPASDTTGDFLPNCTLIAPKIAQMFAIGNNANCISTASIAPGNTAVAANQTSTHTFNTTLSTTPLSSSFSTAAQILNQLHPIQRNAENVTQIHSLLDLLFLVTFDSLDGAKV